jgi:hypothetical protein
MAALAAGTMAFPASATAISATATISAGTLTFVSPASVAFSATLTGVDQNVTSPQSFDVKDATGSGVGWNITATSTTFTSSGHTLSTSAVTEPVAPADTCDASTTCTLATTSVTYPYTLPAATTAPTATKVFNATANTGLGDQTAVNTLSLAVPASTVAGSYTSTWTFSLVSAP